MHPYRNILVHSLVNIGDVVLVTGAVALLRQTCPGARITMMVRPDVAELFNDHPVIDDRALRLQFPQTMGPELESVTYARPDHCNRE